ncbi:MAG: fluoride efflux transporter FluC [bacterium]
MTLLLVITAGAAGVAARYGLSNLFHAAALPWVTVAINVAGSFLLGALVVLPNDWIGEQARVAVGVGLLGGFTTFSTFSVQALLDLESGEPGRALAYMTASVIGGLAAAACGYYGARWLTA